MKPNGLPFLLVFSFLVPALSQCLVVGQDAAEAVQPLIGEGNGDLKGAGMIRQTDESRPDETPIDKDLQRKIRLLQRKLNSDDTEDRDAAEKELLEIGPKALDYLPTEDDSYSAEFNARLRKVRIGLELEVAERVVRPLAITLKGEYPLSVIAAAFESQTGNSVLVQGDPETSLKVDWEKQPFFAALDDLMEKGSLQFQHSKSAVVLSPAPHVKKIKHASYDQGFRTSAVSVRSYLNLNEDDLSTQLNINLQWEPRLRLIKLSIPIDQMVVVPAGTVSEDPPGNDVQISEEEEEEEEVDNGAPTVNRRRNLEFGISRGEYSTFFDLPIKPQADDVKAVDVAGRFKALIAGRSEIFRFEDLPKALENQSEIEKSGIKVKLKGRTDDEFLTGFTLTISFSDAKKSLESHFGWVYENPAYLVDPDGGRHEALTVESAGQTEDQSSMLFLFDKMENPEGWKLEYHSPGILVETVVPFRLQNIRLP